MAEYIERESAYEDFEKCNSENPKWTPGRVKVLIARQKTADVAPVVRCKDCARCGFCEEATNLEVMGFYGYCSRGKRKEGI